MKQEILQIQKGFDNRYSSFIQYLINCIVFPVLPWENLFTKLVIDMRNRINEQIQIIFCRYFDVSI